MMIHGGRKTKEDQIAVFEIGHGRSERMTQLGTDVIYRDVNGDAFQETCGTTNVSVSYNTDT
jgi:hypothetical protein